MIIPSGGWPHRAEDRARLARRSIESALLEARDDPTEVLRKRAFTWMPAGWTSPGPPMVYPHSRRRPCAAFGQRFLPSSGRVIAVRDCQAVPSRRAFAPGDRRRGLAGPGLGPV